MKKFSGLIAIMGCLLSISCATTNTGLQNYPAEIRKAAFNAPAGTLVGVGQSESDNPAAKSIAETRARADIARQMETVVRNMVTDYNASSSAHSGTDSYQEEATQALAKATLTGSRVAEYIVENDLVWVVVYYDKEDARKDITGTVNSSSRLDSSQKAALSAIERMDRAFENLE
jgi:hypothetical protein